MAGTASEILVGLSTSASNPAAVTRLQELAQGIITCDPTTTATSVVKLGDNLASALAIQESTNPYLTFVTTNGSEAIAASKQLTTTDGVTSGTARIVGGRAYSLAAAGTALTNSAAETALASYTIPANTLKAGTMLRVRYQGIATAQAGSTTLTVYLKIGSTALITHAAHAITANDIFCGEFTLTARAAPGATAACVGWGLFGPTADDFDASGTLGMQATILASTNLATNGNLTLAVNGKWSAADASSCRLDNFTVEII